MSDRAVSLGIVNYNGAGYLSRTLDAVERLGPTVADLTLADNGSTDDSVALVRRRFPRVRVIELDENRGPGAARNVLLAAAQRDRVLLIDNDVELLPGCIEALDAALEAHPAAVVAAPAILDAADPDTVQYVGAEPHFLGVPALRCADRPVTSLDSAVSVSGTTITCAVLADRARWGDSTWFDEALFVYLEDHEFGLRAALRGFELLNVPAARCLHGEGTVGLSVRQTGRFTPTRVRHTMLNRWQVLLKLYQLRTLARFTPALAAFELFQLLGAVRKGWLGHWLWAGAQLLRRLPDLRRRRRAFAGQRRRADLDVLVAGPFPYNKAMHTGRIEHAARRTLDAIAQFNWRLAGGRR